VEAPPPASGCAWKADVQPAPPMSARHPAFRLCSLHAPLEERVGKLVKHKLVEKPE
jgi:hypothetical protein